MLTEHELIERFGTHSPLDGGLAHEGMYELFYCFAKVVNRELPNSREAALVMTALEEASMWAHKALARQDPLVRKNYHEETSKTD